MVEKPPTGDTPVKYSLSYNNYKNTIIINTFKHKRKQLIFSKIQHNIINIVKLYSF